MRPFAHLVVIATLAALVGAVVVQADESQPGVFGAGDVELVSWQTEDNPWMDYSADGGVMGCGGAACCGEAMCSDGAMCCGGTSGIIAGVELPLLQAHYGACAVDIPGQQVLLPECLPSFGHEATPRFWLGYETCDGLAFRVRYWQYDHSASAVDVGNRYYVDVGLAAENLDFEIAQSGRFCNWELEIAGGARWAKIADDIDIDYDSYLAAWARDFEGGGPTFAIAARRPLCGSALALVANFRASLIYGDTHLAFNDDVLQMVEDMAATIEDHLVEIYEIQVGAEWSRVTCAGWRLAGRVVLEGQAWELAPGPGPLGLFDTNIGFVGPSFSLAIER